MKTSFNRAAALLLPAAMLVFGATGGCDNSETICEPCVRQELAWESQKPAPFGSMNFRGTFGVGGHIYMYGDLGRIAHFDGTDWELMQTPTSYNLINMWGSSPGDLYAVNGNYQMVHFNGTSWTSLILPAQMYAYPRAVWGLSASDVWVLGYGFSAYHYDGTGWSDELLPGTYNMNEIWGSSGSNVYAVGYNGDILHYNGSYWSEINHGLTTNQLYGIWGSGSNDIWAFGDNGTLLHYNGSIWSDLSGDPPMGANFIYDAQGNAADDIYFCAGNLIYHYDGSDISLFADWQDLFNGGEGIWVEGDIIYQSGYYGCISFYDGSEWSFVQDDCDISLNDIWTDGPSNAWAVGGMNTVYRYDGVDWTKQPALAIPGGDLNSIDGEGGVIYACGEGGSIVRHNGSGWTDISDESVTQQDLTGCFVTGTEAFFVGYQGTILHFDGTTLAAMSSGTTEYFTAVWGSGADDVYAAGRDGSILHYNGTAWSEVFASSEIRFIDIWGSPAGHVYACGSQGAVAHWDGSTWTIDNADTREELQGIWGSSDTDIYASGGWSISHFDGERWTDLNLYLTIPAGNMRAIHGSAADNIFVAGAYGNILHYGPER